MGNMGLLPAIGRGLRAGGGVLSPDVYATQEKERLIEEQQTQARKDQLFQLVLAGVQSGGIDPESGRKALQAIRPDLQLPEGAIGPGMAAKRAQAKALQEQQDREALAATNKQLGLPEYAPSSVTGAAYNAQHRASKIDNALISLQLPGGRKATLRRGDPRVDELLSAGAVEYEKPESNRSELGDQRDRKIQSLVRQGLSVADASNVIDGVVDVKINDATGRVVLTNKATGTAKEVPISGSEPPRAEVPPEQTLTAGAERGVGTSGPVSAANELYGRVAGLVGAPVPRQTMKDRQQLRTATGDLIRALSINSKFPVGEQEMLRKEIDLGPSLIDSPAAQQARMASVRDSLQTRLNQVLRDASDVNMPEELRKERMIQASSIRNFLDLLGGDSSKSIMDEADAILRGK